MLRRLPKCSLKLSIFHSVFVYIREVFFVFFSRAAMFRRNSFGPSLNHAPTSLRNRVPPLILDKELLVQRSFFLFLLLAHRMHLGELNVQMLITKTYKRGGENPPQKHATATRVLRLASVRPVGAPSLRRTIRPTSLVYFPPVSCLLSPVTPLSSRGQVAAFVAENSGLPRFRVRSGPF